MRVQGGEKVQVREYRTQKEFQDNVVQLLEEISDKIDIIETALKRPRLH